MSNVTYMITDGTVEVPLTNHGVEGLVADRGGLEQAIIDPEAEFAPIQPDGARLTSYRYNPALENWTLHLFGKDQNDAARELQKLYKLLRKAREYHLTNWQATPVYIHAKANNESFSRYSLVYGMTSNALPSLYALDFTKASLLTELQFTIAREPFWRSHPPRTLPTAIDLTPVAGSPSTQSNLKNQIFSNYRHDNDLTHIYMYDDSLTAFSSNFIASSSFPLWEVSGSTPAANDAIYLGSTDGVWFNAVFNIAVAGSASGLTFVIEYWDGSAWSTASNAALHPTRVGTGSGIGFTGPLILKSSGESDWATTTINGVSAHWLRIRISAVTSWTTVPEQGGQVVYSPNDAYIEYPSTGIAGDENALAQIRMQNNTHITSNEIGWLICGLKTRGLDSFTSRLNFGGQNPTDWTESYDTDTSQTADAEAPGGNMALCDFSSNQTLQTRSQLTLSAANEKDFEGDYRIFLRCKQVNGSAGDVSVRLDIQHSIITVGETVDLQFADDEEVVDLGTFSINPLQQISGETYFARGLIFILKASSANGTTPDLELYDLILMPIDEWAMVSRDTGLNFQTLNFSDWLVLDSGVQREGAFEYRSLASDIDDYQPLSEWEGQGSLPTLPPGRKAQLHYLVVATTTADTYFRAQNGLAMAAEIYPHMRWIALRGAD